MSLRNAEDVALRVALRRVGSRRVAFRCVVVPEELGRTPSDPAAEEPQKKNARQKKEWEGSEDVGNKENRGTVFVAP